MDAAYKKLLDWSLGNGKKIRETFDRLARHKKADQVVHKAHEQAFEEIDCLACANCCRTTGPLLQAQDITRISKRLKQSESSFVSQYLRVDEDGDHVFKTMPCPFLGSDNYCLVYSDRPRACREFPHTDRPGQLNIAHLTRKNARICPAVSRIAQIISAIDAR